MREWLARLRDWLRRRSADGFILLQLGLIAAALWFMMAGIPVWLARATGWEYVYSSRAILLVGVATTVALVRSLAQARNDHVSKLNSVWLFAGIALLAIGALYQTNVQLSRFETLPAIVSSALFFAVLFVCFWRGSVAASCLLLVVPQFYACALINPVARGLPGITQSPLRRWLTDAQALRPNAR